MNTTCYLKQSLFLKKTTTGREKSKTKYKNKTFGSPLLTLPDTVIANIAAYLNYKDTLNFASTCKKIYHVTNDFLSSSEAFYRQFAPTVTPSILSNSHERYTENIRPWLMRSKKFKAIRKLDTMSKYYLSPQSFGKILFHAVSAILENAKYWKISEVRRYTTADLIQKNNLPFFVKLSPSRKIAAICYYKVADNLKFLIKSFATKGPNKNRIYCLFELGPYALEDMKFIDEENIYLALLNKDEDNQEHILIQHYKNKTLLTQQKIEFESTIHKIQFSLNLKVLVVSTSVNISHSRLNTLFIFTCNKEGEWLQKQEINMEGPISHISLSPKGEEILLNNEEDYQLLKNNGNGNWEQKSDFPKLHKLNCPSGSGFSPNGSYLITNTLNILAVHGRRALFFPHCKKKHLSNLFTRNSSGKRWTEIQQKIYTNGFNKKPSFSNNSRIILVISERSVFKAFVINDKKKRLREIKIKYGKNQESFHDLRIESFNGHTLLATQEKNSLHNNHTPLVEFEIIPKK